MSQAHTELSVYLSGSIKKGKSDERDTFWTNADQDQIRRELSPLTVHMLNPASRSDDLADFLGTFGRDLFQVAAADAILVDVRDRRGIGVGSEMTVAKCLGIPVVSICPPESHYRRDSFTFLDQSLDSWTHPFVHGLSDAIVDSVTDACAWLREAQPWKRPVQRNITYSGLTVANAIQHYLRAQLPRDTEMLEIVESSARLNEKRESWAR